VEKEGEEEREVREKDRWCGRDSGDEEMEARNREGKNRRNRDETRSERSKFNAERRRRRRGRSKGKKKSSLPSLVIFSLLTLLQEALKLEPPVRVGRQRLDLRAVGRVVGDGPVQEPVRASQGLGGVFRRPHRIGGARGRGDGLVDDL
jgi:hypothetical protein